jgi:hypothetical protein
MYLLPKTPTARHPSREIGHRDRGRIETHQEDKLGNKISASAARFAGGLFEWTGTLAGPAPSSRLLTSRRGCVGSTKRGLLCLEIN